MVFSIADDFVIDYDGITKEICWVKTIGGK